MHSVTRDPWILTSAAPPLGVVVLVHGLNNRPEIMTDIGRSLAAKGFHSYIAGLTGHEQGQEWERVDYAAAWTKDVTEAAQIARDRFPGIPVHNVSYSTGALASLAASEHDRPFHRMAFFAPALVPNFRAQLVRGLLPFKYFGLSLPSLAPEKGRAHSGTSLRAYSGFFRLLDGVQNDDARHAWNTLPILLLMERGDELLDFEGTQEFACARPWTIHEVRSAPADPSALRHLVIDPESTGPEEWTRIIDVVAAFLSADFSESPNAAFRRNPISR